MSAKFISSNLLNSGRFSVSGKDENESVREKTAGNHDKTPGTSADAPDNVSEKTEPIQRDQDEAHVQELIAREEDNIRLTAVSERIADTARGKREVAEMLRETVSDIKQRTETLDSYRKMFESIAADIAELPAEIDQENLPAARRATDNARLEMARFEKDVLNRHASANTAKTTTNPQGDLANIPFLKLTKIGLAFTWPVAIAIVLSAILAIVVLYGLFTV
jgi:septal ring factor EnvC (AmiA/AmiB activator)